MRNHVVIAGTGRAGTTFLIELLTALRLDTGVADGELLYFPAANAGLEFDFTAPDAWSKAPYIVKNPKFSTALAGLIRRNVIKVDHLLLPVRDIGQASDSRIRLHRAGGGMPPLRRAWKKIRGKYGVPGGLYDVKRAGDQEALLRHNLSELVATIAEFDIPSTIMQFPRIVDDEDYLFDKLSPIFPTIERDEFAQAFREVSRPDKVSLR